MKAKLEFEGSRVRLTVPPATWSSPVFEALMGGFPAMVLDSPWNRMSATAPASFDLPLTAWRHFMRHFIRGFEYHAMHQAAGAAPDSWSVEVDGVEYTTIKDIPPQAEVKRGAGTFVVTDSRMRVTDPGYPSRKDAVVLGAVDGTWLVEAVLRDGHNGYAPAVLTATHEGALAGVLSRAEFHTTGAMVDVDSAQCGFFDDAKYPTEAREFEYEEGTFYKRACEVVECSADGWETQKDLPMGTLDGDIGFNSRTFHGDGSYELLVRTEPTVGMVCAARLVFDTRGPTELRARNADEVPEGLQPEPRRVMTRRVGYPGTSGLGRMRNRRLTGL